MIPVSVLLGCDSV